MTSRIILILMRLVEDKESEFGSSFEVKIGSSPLGDLWSGFLPRKDLTLFDAINTK